MGRKTADLSGRKFGRLTVISRVPRRPKAPGSAMWLCRCDCGTSAVVASNSLRTGVTQSCGCLRTESLVARNTTHGLAGRGSKARAYASWGNMIRRYAPRGAVCERWLEYPAFLADMGERPPGMTLRRKDKSQPFSRENCTWGDLPRLNPDTVARIRELRSARMTRAAIGAWLGLHPDTVSRAVSGSKTRQGTPADGPGRPDEPDRSH